MLEVEVKYRVSDHAPVRAKLTAWGADPRPVREDCDHYFAAPDRDFAATDEAVRLRTTGPANVFTYKGPKRAGPTKTRTEIEVPIEPGAAAARAAVEFLTALRYKPVAVVGKVRQVYAFARDGFAVEACLDEVGAIGKFVELEILATESQLDAATAVVLGLAADLGLVETERRSYLELLLAQPHATPRPSRPMSL